METTIQIRNWSDAARSVRRIAKRARKGIESADLRALAVRSAIQNYRNKLWAKAVNTSRGQAQAHLVRPKYAMSARQLKQIGKKR